MTQFYDLSDNKNGFIIRGLNFFDNNTLLYGGDCSSVNLLNHRSNVIVPKLLFNKTKN